MSHEVETMAFAHEVPWHGLGNRVDPTVSIEEMLKASGLDWTVKLAPCFAYDDETQTALPTGRQALIRSTDKKVLTVTGENWHPVQNADALDFFRTYTDAGGATLETAGSLRGGKIVWGLASLNEQFTIGTADTVKGYLLLLSYHEVGNATAIFPTDVRVVCANTMRRALDTVGSQYHRQNHLKAFNPDLAKKAIDLHRVRLGEAKLEAEALSSLELSEFEAVRFLARYFQPEVAEMAKDKNASQAEIDNKVKELLDNTDEQHKNLEAVLKSYNTAPGAQPGTGWGVLNGVTHWCDHVAGREQDARLFNSWLGKRSLLKLDVNKKLLKLADFQQA